ncbi:MAG: hypothetical protein OXN81_16130 [Alphaproteobacteria bacterium]|nr:hypothetical protein [Alphaproteobacteria bacterium]
MFNNPFSSFHDTVAEAKEEREQLDRLLTISTPRERLLVALIALLLFLLAAWLLFGNVARSLALDGLLVEAGETLPEGRRAVQALVWVGSDAAPRIEVGMPAALELALADGDSDIIEGRIAAIAAVPLSEGLAALSARVPVAVYRVDIALDESLDPASLAGRNCRIVIELGSQSLVSLMRTGQS